ncbi:hypothetical protein UPYG_G00286920 [Umbra pygmaea]|uniref:Uncharacterized protein n=1 Tax=Umbra pygmaea TaxID=75934 RepID=A0ABD0WQD8_UMBPY
MLRRQELMFVVNYISQKKKLCKPIRKYVFVCALFTPSKRLDFIRDLSSYFFDLAELQPWSAFHALSFLYSSKKAVQESGTGSGDVKSSEKSNGCPVVSNGACKTEANGVATNGPAADAPVTSVSDKKTD